jgi:hypothetical protein
MCGSSRVGIVAAASPIAASPDICSTINNRTETMKMRAHIYSDNQVTPCVPGTISEVV